MSDLKCPYCNQPVDAGLSCVNDRCPHKLRAEFLQKKIFYDLKGGGGSITTYQFLAGVETYFGDPLYYLDGETKVYLSPWEYGRLDLYKKGAGQPRPDRQDNDITHRAFWAMEELRKIPREL